MFEEHARLEEIQESGEVVLDKNTQDKLYERYQKNSKAKKGFQQNDELDVIGWNFSESDVKSETKSQ